MEAIDLVVLGAGVAGLAAATHAARSGLVVTVIDPQGAGGQVASVDLVDNLPGHAPMAGWELGPLLQEQAAEAGAGFMLATAQSLRPDAAGWQVESDDGTLLARAVVVATGSHRRSLGVPGEHRLQGFGVSHCASCDGPLMRGLRVVVVGGGDAAVSEAAVLAAHAREVLLVYRAASLRARSSLVEQLGAAGAVALMPDHEVLEVLGERNVTALRLRHTPSGNEHVLEAEGVFVNIGLLPNTTFLGQLLALDETGHIVTDPALQSSLPGLFAAGDVRSGSASTLAESAADGAKAAAGVQRFLRGQRGPAPA